MNYQNFAKKVVESEEGRPHIFSVGQAGYIIKNSKGNLLGIDLYLSECVEELEGHIGFKRLQPHILEADELALDILIATHEHLDHYDKDSMPDLMAGGKTTLYASVNCKEYVESSSIKKENVNYVGPGDSAKDSGFSIHFVECDHGEGAPDAFGVVVETDGIVIYEAGDTCLRKDYAKNVIDEFGKIDILIAPINGAYGNMDENDCVELVKYMNPSIVVPCHFGMFASHGGNPGLFLELMKKEKMDNKVRFLSIGEELKWE